MLNQLLNRESTSLSATKTGLKLNEWAPIKSLPKRYQDEILNRSKVKEFSAGEVIFVIEADDEDDFYLLEGAVQFIDGSRRVVETLEHSGEQSLELIDHHRPRIYTAKATQNCKVFVTRRTFSDTLNSASAGKQAIPEVEVNEIEMEGSGNWMLSMLSSSVFSSLPPENLQKIFINMDTSKVAAGTTIVEQGIQGKNFYLIQHGECVITQQDASGVKKVLSHLSSGETFGERSLISGAASDISVEMKSDGILMMLPKESFNQLVQQPLLNTVSIEKANTLISEGAAWIDVRTKAEYQTQAIKDSTNIDLENLYTAIKDLSPNKTYILCGNSESHAMTSAFLLSIHGFTVYSLSSSIKAYLASNTDAQVSIQKVAQEAIPIPVLESTVADEIPLATQAESTLELTIEQTPQIKVNTAAITKNMQNLSLDIEQQIRKEINDLFILKQKELEFEIEQRFKQYHQVTAKLMKKKLDDLTLVQQVQAKLAAKKS